MRMLQHPFLILKLFPGVRYKQKQKREELQAPCQHIKGQHQLRPAGKYGKILGRSHQLQSGADVVQGGGHSGKVGDQIMSVKPHEQDGKAKINT